MSSDIVERLRYAAEMRDDLKQRYWHRASGLKREAADHIEALQAELARAREALEIADGWLPCVEGHLRDGQNFKRDREIVRRALQHKEGKTG